MANNTENIEKDITDAITELDRSNAGLLKAHEDYKNIVKKHEQMNNELREALARERKQHLGNLKQLEARLSKLMVISEALNRQLETLDKPRKKKKYFIFF